MEKGICYIVCAGENYGLPFAPKESDMVIAVDGGYEYLKDIGIPVDVAIGDFDSLNYVPNVEKVVKLQEEKDETDTYSAINYGIQQGFKNFHIYCGTGGELAHTLANIQCLAYLAKQGLKGLLFDKSHIMTAIHNGELIINNNKKGTISVLSLSSEALGVTLSGLKYPLNNYDMTNDFPIGISNEFTGVVAKITVRRGTLLIRYQF